MNLVPGGDAGDFITYKFHIPATEVELGSPSDFNKGWMAKSPEIAFKVVKENFPWLEYTFEKLGNQLSVEAVGYRRERYHLDNPKMGASNNAVLLLNITNHGLSD